MAAKGKKEFAMNDDNAEAEFLDAIFRAEFDAFEGLKNSEGEITANGIAAIYEETGSSEPAASDGIVVVSDIPDNVEGEAGSGREARRQKAASSGVAGAPRSGGFALGQGISSESADTTGTVKKSEKKRKNNPQKLMTVEAGDVQNADKKDAGKDTISSEIVAASLGRVEEVPYRKSETGNQNQGGDASGVSTFMHQSEVSNSPHREGETVAENQAGDASGSGSLPPPLSIQVDEVVRGLSGVRTASQVYLINIGMLEPYPDQPFKSYPEDKLRELADDIKRVGILSPILARRNRNKLQILAGHNRWNAAKLAGLAEVPVLISDADDDQAILVVTSTNLRQREKLSHSEKAFAYKMQMDALKRQGQRGTESYNASSFITEQTGDSRIQIHRYIRLTELNVGLLELLDRGKISMTPAVSVSYLDAAAQSHVLDLIRDFGVSLTIERANALKNLMIEKNGDPLGELEIDGVLLQLDKRGENGRGGRFNFERIKGYLPKGLDGTEAEKYIIAALRAYKRV